MRKKNRKKLVSPLLRKRSPVLKKTTCLIVVLLFTLMTIGTVFAEQPLDIWENEELQEIEDNASLPERMFSGIIMSFSNFFLRIFGLQDISMLVFQVMPESEQIRDETWWNSWWEWNYDADSLILHTFPSEWFEVIEVFYMSIERILPGPLVVAIALAGIFMLFTASSGGKTNSKDYILGLIIALLALRFGPYLFGVIFDINKAFVDLFREVAENTAGVPVSEVGFLEMFYQPEALSIGTALLVLIGTLMVAVFNFQYTVRMITLGVLIMLFPVMVFLSAFPHSRQTIGFWTKELLSNVFLQTGHAAVIAFFYSLMFMGDGLSLFVMFVFLGSLNSTANLIRSLIGGQQAPRGAMGMGMGMLGLGAVMSIGKMAKGRYSGAGGGIGGGGGLVGNPVSHATGKGSGSGGIGEMASQGIASPESSGGSLKRFAGTGMAVAGGVGGAMVGGIATGATTGNPGLGMTVGGLGGAYVGGGVGSSAGSAGDFYNSARREARSRTATSTSGTKVTTGQVAREKLGMKEGLGLSKENSAGRLYDKQSMGTIGQRIATQVFGAREGNLGYYAGVGTSMVARSGNPEGRAFGDEIKQHRDQQVSTHQEATETYENHKPRYEAVRNEYMAEIESAKQYPVVKAGDCTPEQILDPDLKKRYSSHKMTEHNLKKKQIQAADQTRHERVGEEMKRKAEDIRKTQKVAKAEGRPITHYV